MNDEILIDPMACATHRSIKEGGEWVEMSPQSRRISAFELYQHDFGQCGSYIAYKFANGAIWDSIVGWRFTKEPSDEFAQAG